MTIHEIRVTPEQIELTYSRDGQRTRKTHRVKRTPKEMALKAAIRVTVAVDACEQLLEYLETSGGLD